MVFFAFMPVWRFVIIFRFLKIVMFVKIRLKGKNEEGKKPNLEDAQRGVGEGCEHSTVNPSVLFLIPWAI